MARKSTILTHAKKKEIDQEIIRGASYRRIAAQFQVSATTIRRYINRGFAEQLSRAKERRELFDAQKLVQGVEEWRKEVRELHAKAKKKGSLHTALAAIDRAVKLIELQGRLIGRVHDFGFFQINLIESREWAQVKQIMLNVLKNHASLRERFLQALEDIANE